MAVAATLHVFCRNHFELYSAQTGISSKLHEVEASKHSQKHLVAALDLCDGQETELLLCYNRNYLPCCATCMACRCSSETNSNCYFAHTNIPTHRHLSFSEVARRGQYRYLHNWQQSFDAQCQRYNNQLARIVEQRKHSQFWQYGRRQVQQ